MEGLGVYLAREPKAFEYAYFCKEPVADGDESVGALIECEVEMYSLLLLLVFCSALSFRVSYLHFPPPTPSFSLLLG